MLTASSGQQEAAPDLAQMNCPQKLDWPEASSRRGECLSSVLHWTQALERCGDAVMVVPADVLVDSDPECGAVDVDGVVEALFFELTEEVLHHGVVEAVALTGHRLRCAGRGEVLCQDRCWY